ncbi:TetR/AcrR family transcriptional regulator [Fodinicola feengrottensis]|uniref:TetR/AcrR family transcriptional regulator n=1 Tax=Fodinicola feengrottensis TaxID=435914 RepID=A0ABN2J3S2_9ACTN
MSRQDWAEAALAALADGGLAAVAVEPLAIRLGTTKGSFYWHFANREALVQAAVERWADEHTEALIRQLEPVSDPATRLRQLFEAAIGSGRISRAELALLAHADDPLVAPVLSRVTARRVDFIAACYAETGVPPGDARRHAVLAYTAHIGLIQAQRASGGTLLADRDRPAYLDFLYRVISVERPPRR